MAELYLKYRPKTFAEVVGQPEAIRQLADLGKRGSLPHALLLTGPSGCGKTTIARILRAKLKCSDNDFIEMNAADARGIDVIRAIRQQAGAAPLGGDCRVWLIDECHQLTSEAQDSFLKLLEDTPRHVFFMLATTDPRKLKKTIITRCTEIRCKPVAAGELEKLIVKIAGEEGATLDKEVVAKAAEAADGSPRKALVILHAIIGIVDIGDQMAAIAQQNVEGQAIEIARALLNGAAWPKVAAVLKAVDEDPEGLRRMVLGYCRSVLLGGGKFQERAAMIIDEFADNFFDSGAAGLARACYAVAAGK